jgi:hypothetical protein
MKCENCDNYVAKTDACLFIGKLKKWNKQLTETRGCKVYEEKKKEGK